MKEKEFYQTKIPQERYCNSLSTWVFNSKQWKKICVPKKEEKERKKPKKMLKKKTSCCKLQNTSFSCFPLDRNIRRENIIHYEELGEKRCTHRSKRTGGWPPMQWNEASGVSRGGSLSLSLSPSRIQKCSFFLFHVYLKWYMGLGSKLDPLGCELGSELDPFGMRTNVKHLSHVHILRVPYPHKKSTWDKIKV